MIMTIVIIVIIVIIVVLLLLLLSLLSASCCDLRRAACLQSRKPIQGFGDLEYVLSSNEPIRVISPCTLTRSIPTFRNNKPKGLMKIELLFGGT